MSLLNDISRTVGEKVYKTRHGYLITVNKPLGGNLIISQTRDGFIIRDKTLVDLPIGFQFTDEHGWIKQYWTLNGKMHCATGPAEIYMYRPTDINGRPDIHMKWFWNGLCHREDGPAEEKYTQMSFKQIDPDHIQERAKKVEYRWYKDGVLWGKPSIMKGDGFVRLRKEGKIIHTDIHSMEIMWEYHTTDFTTSKRNLLPEKIRIEDYAESEDGITGNIVSSSWFNNHERYVFDSGEFPQSSYLSMVDLWKWPFYKDTAIEYLMREDFMKVEE